MEPANSFPFLIVDQFQSIMLYINIQYIQITFIEKLTSSEYNIVIEIFSNVNIAFHNDKIHCFINPYTIRERHKRKEKSSYLPALSNPNNSY